MDLRKPVIRNLIIERIRTGGASGHGLVDVFCYLIKLGVSPDEATTAMALFVDEAIAAKAQRVELADAGIPTVEN